MHVRESRKLGTANENSTCLLLVMVRPKGCANHEEGTTLSREYTCAKIVSFSYFEATCTLHFQTHRLNLSLPTSSTILCSQRFHTDQQLLSEHVHGIIVSSLLLPRPLDVMAGRG